ncbi:hypothetical protein [Vogesella oryzae]|nr:hypothetical protein [Vogesella oryzae]
MSAVAAQNKAAHGRPCCCCGKVGRMPGSDACTGIAMLWRAA